MCISFADAMQLDVLACQIEAVQFMSSQISKENKKIASFCSCALKLASGRTKSRPEVGKTCIDSLIKSNTWCQWSQ